MAINSGAIVGPAIGAGLYYLFSFNAILISSMVAYLALALVLALIRFSPPEATVPQETQGQDQPTSTGVFTAIVIAGCVYWVIYAQWALIVPLMAEANLGSREASSSIYVANAILVLALQYPLLVVALRKIKDVTILLVGFSLFIPAFFILYLPAGISIPILFCIVFSLGELLVSPTLDSLVAKFAPTNLGLTRSYGLTDSISGISSIAGSAAGGYLISSTSGIHGTAMLCLPASVLALVISLYMKRKIGSR